MRGVGHKILRNTLGHKKTTVEVATAETGRDDEESFECG